MVRGLWSQAPRSPPWLRHQCPLYSWMLLGDPCPGPPPPPCQHGGAPPGSPSSPCLHHGADLALPAFFPALWTFLWFVGFCFLTNQWAATKEADVLVGADSARAAITFSFFSIFSWVGGPGRTRVAVSLEKGGGRLNSGLPAGCTGLPGLPALQGRSGRLHPELRRSHPRPQHSLRLLPWRVCGQLPTATLHPERRDR